MAHSIKEGQSENIFNIKVGEFQGSLEALLEMVQKRKMHISDVSLAQVADDYMAYVRSLESKVGTLPSSEMANFIVIAATLLLIKSKSLLPTLELSLEEEEDIKELEERLQLYSIYTQASEALRLQVKSGKCLHEPRQIKQEVGPRFAPAQNITIDTLCGAMGDVLGQLPKVESKPEAEIVESVNIEEVMHSLLERVESAVQQSFKSMAGGESASKQDVLVHFLALLELVKDGVLLAEQGDTYGDILITK